MKNMNNELDEILNGSSLKTGIIERLEELQQAMSKQMDDHLSKPKYRNDVWSICKLPNLTNTHQKLVLAYLYDVKKASSMEVIEVLQLNRPSFNRAANDLMQLGYIVKLNYGNWALAETNIF